MVGEAGPELFQPGQTGRIVPNDQLQSTNGDIVNINFNISTVDAKGFDELLSSRRELIVNTVNEAMRERGQRGLTA
jgi:predicted transcriptional regulator